MSYLCVLWFAGHEYAVDNLQFAEHIDPENEAIKVCLLLALNVTVYSDKGLKTTDTLFMQQEP